MAKKINPLQNRLDSVTAYHWESLTEIYSKLCKFDPPKIVINNRFTKTGGMAYQEDRIIHLGGKFFDKFYNNMMLVILPHEIAHIADYDLYGTSEKKCGHGKNWARIMVQLGLEPAKYHSMEL